QEDHVSMGSISGRKTLKIIKNLEKILAIELLCATQAFDFRRPLRSGPALEACHHLVRNRIAHATNDRLFGQDIHKALKIVRSRELIHLVNQHMGDQDFSDQHQEFALFKDY
ncbi:MAG: aromatic amino acid lyase, partial [Saprospiraceae bacterium]|nr:aromatic amino acid lyase [Saprospiraceae bacterium]